MILDGVLLLAAYTPRSQAYAQAMASVGLRPQDILIFGSSGGKLPGQANNIVKTERKCAVFIPDMSESLDETVKINNWNSTTVFAENVNDQIIVKKLSILKPRLVIYAGYGSQIVKQDLLDIAPFLHAHSGWLPDYRGSTTLYYSWIKEGCCGVSGILLNDKIDCGSLVGQKKYPPPPPGVDPDYIYDAAIRADLLVEMLQEYARNGKFINIKDQLPGGNDYYVIHPVLKHIALLQNEDSPHKNL